MGSLMVTFESPVDEDFSDAILKILDEDCGEYEVKVSLSQYENGPVKFVAEQIKPRKRLLAEEVLR